MKYSNTVEYNISTKLDSSGLTKMQNQIREIELSLQRMGDKQGGFLAGQVEQARKELQGLNKALTEAFNPSLGIIDISKFRAELTKGKVDSEGLASAFRLAGSDGQVAFNNLISQLGTFDAGMQRTSSAVDKMWTTFQNTFRWGLVSSFFSQFMNAIHSSVDYVKELDDSLTQIMLVTNYNRDSMNQFAKSANEAAKAVSMTTTGMTNASLIFAQQGYDLNQSQELATLSAKVANASQQDTATTSDQITAYMNAYGLENSISELTQAMDNWALIANISAADVSELAQASQRAASMASAVGVSGEQLASQIATIESVTREAPEQIGNGLKTLYARFSDIAAGGEDEDGFTLGKVTSELQAIGVQIFDQMGNIRDVGDIMEDLMVIWDDLDQTSKVAASQALAGKYQVNRFMALMDNSDMYQEYKGATGNAAMGTLDTMNEEYANSIAGRTAKMQATLEGIFSSIFDTDTVYPFVDAMQTFLDLTQEFIEAVGGGGPVITGVIALIGRLFSKNIANAFVDTKINNNLSKIQAENYKNAPAAIAQLGLSNPNPENQNTKALLNFAQEGAKMAPNMSEQGLENYNRLLKENTQLSNQAAEAQQNFEDVISKVNAELGINLNAKDSITKDESGLNVTPLLDILQQASNNEQFGQSKEYWESATKAADSYAKKLAEVHRELIEYRKIENPSQDTTDKVKQKVKELKTEIDALRGTSAQSSESIDQIERTIDLLNGTLDETDKQTDDWKESLKDSSAEVEKLQSNATTLIKILEELSKTGGLKDKSGVEALLNELYAAQSKATATQGAAQGGQRQMTSFISDTEDVIKVKNIIDTTSAIGELAFAWQSFQHLGSLWSDESLSNGEKTLQTIINITMALSQLIRVMDKLNLGQKITGLFSSDETKNNLENVKIEISETTKEIARQKEILKSIKPLKEQINVLNERENQIQGKLFSNSKGVNELGRRRVDLNQQIKDLTNQINKATEDGKITEEALKALEDERNAKIVQRQMLEKQTTAELAKQKMMSAALNIGLGIALAAIAAGIGAIQEQERQRIQKITNNAEDSRAKLEAINSSDFFKKWDSFKENGELTDELKDSMAALAQQMGINIEVQDIYAGNIEQLNDKIRDNIELEKQRARTNIEAENEEFEAQLNKNSIQAAQIGGTVTTAAGTFNSAVDYIGQAGAVKTLSERLGELANAQSAVATARKEFGKDSLEYDNALNQYQKLTDQLTDEGIDIEKVQNNFKQLANLAVEEFKAGRDAQSISGAEWIDFLGSDNEIKEYMESLGEESALQFKLGLLSQSDSENPLYSMIKGPGQIDLSNANITEETSLDLENLVQSGIKPEELGFKTWDDFAQAFVSAGNNAELTINPKINLESKYDFDSQEEIEQYLKDYTDIDSNTLETATQIRVDAYSEKGNRYNGAVDYAEQQNALAENNFNQAEQEQASAGNLHVLEEATQKLNEAESKLIDTQNKLTEAQADAEHDQEMYEKSMKQSAAAAARMIKTLDKMNDHFDDNKEILEEGSESTIDYAEALAETKEDLAGLLDIDPSMLSNEFASSEEALEAMNTMLHGTEEEAEAAYEHLRELAAADVINNLEFNIPVGLEYSDGTEVTAESIQQTLMDMISTLNAQDLTIGMEADIDTADWYARVNELLASGAITADQLTQVLSSAGYKGQIKYEEAEGEYPATTYTVVVEGQQTIPVTAGKDDASSIVAPSVIKMIPQTEMVHGKTVIPVLEGASQAGGFTNGGGGHHQPSGGGGGSCFVAGTLITTLTGFSPIEQIKQGDIVLSYNELLHQLEYSTVVQTMIHDVVEPIYTLYIKDEQLRVTGIHRFLISHDIFHSVPQWVPAADLQIGDWMFLADGTWHLIHNIEINVEHQIVYNFEVAGNHNYYVGRNQILAHNKGGKSCFIAGTLVSIRNNEYQYIEDIRRGDIVLSYNEKTRRNEYSQVLQTMTHEINEEVYLICTEETELSVTGNHKFFVKRNNKVEWVEAADLQVNDLMFFADYSWHEIWHVEANIKTTTVYNFEVSHNHNYYVGIDQILAHNKGGKGGSGSGSKAKTIKPKEKEEHEKDYYEEVDNQLKKTEKTLSKIEKENDRLTGDKARANQNKQLTLLEKELKLQEKKLKILTEQEKVDVAASLQKADKELEEFAKTLGIDWKMPDPVYDEDGIISNYEEMSAAINDLHNRLIEQYNAAAAAGNEELTKQIEEQLSKIDKKGEDLLKKAKRMNAIQTEIEDITATIEDLKDSIEDIRIEAYKASQDALKELVELKEQEAEIDALFHDANPNSYIDRWSIDGTPFVELKQVMQEINSISNIGMDQATAYFDNLIAERKKALETASEDEKAAIQSTIDFYTEEKSKLSEDNLENGILGIRRRNLEQLKEWMDNPSNPSNPFGDNIAALQEAYKTEYEALLEQAKEERERAQKARDKYLEVMDDIQDGIERQIDGYDRLLDKLERINDTYQLYYGEDSYDGILDIMDQQANTMSSELDQLTNAYNYWTNQYQIALANGDEKLIHEIEDKMNDAEDAMLDKAAELAEHFVEMYETSVNAAIQKMTNSLWGGGPGQMDLEDQSTMWELQKDYMQNYKDDVEKAFEIDKLRSKYISLLNDAQGMSLQTQNKIRAQMQEQLDLLENQTTMSDYDVKLANAKLEILQKQIALEDAQRNKNKMQLRRDTQGNYRYVYTADQGNVQQAQDELNESKYDAYEMTKEQTIANNDRAISLYNDYMEKVAAISKKYQDDEAAREAALSALADEYREIFKALREDYADTTNGMYDLLTWMIDNTTSNTTDAAMSMLDRLYDKNGEVKENTGIAWRDLATNITKNVLGNIDKAAQEMFEDIDISASSLASSIAGPNGPLSKIGATANTLTGTLNKATAATAQLGAATRELFGYLAADDGELARATNQMAEYEEKLKGALSETSKYAEALKQANAEIQAKTEEARNYKTKYEYASGQKELKKDSVVKVKQGTFVYYDRRGQDQYDDTGSYGWYLPQDMWVKLGTPNPDAPKAYNFYATGASLSAFGDRQETSGSDSRAGEAPADERHHQWWHLDEATLKRSIIDGLDTGGYTGEWNESTPFYKNGKVAMLHQKELVLNATDTQNILAAVEMIRNISGNNMANLLGKTGTSRLGFNISADYNPTTEQRVEIQATFPNATDADDIRTALLGLSDKAFQYAHRTI